MKTKKGLVSVLILNWNTKSFIVECLKCLRVQSYKELEVIVVDNGSTDGSLEILRKHKKIKLIENKTNVGFAEGNNQALSLSKGEYVLALNADTTFDKNMISGLVNFMKKHPKAAAIQPKLVFMSDHNKLDCVGAYQTWSGIPYYFGLYKDARLPKYNQDMQVYSVKGACMMTRRSVIDKVGFLDCKMFAYFEETDFCHRAWLAGFQCWYTSSVSVNHFVGATIGHRDSANFIYYSFRNRIKSYLKNFGIDTLLFLVPLHLTALMGMVFISPHARSIFRAIWYNIINFPDILQERQIAQRLRQVDDSVLRRTWFKNPRLDYYYYLVVDISKYQD